MEIMNVITNLISSVGFPIACCIIMFYQNNKLRETLDNNTNVLIQLKNEIEKKV